MPTPTFFDFVRTQWTRLPPIAPVDLSGQTMAVTGANTGLGLEAVKHFARMGPEHLVIVCRSRPKGEQAVAGSRSHDLVSETRTHACAEVKAATGVTPELLLMDMSDFSAVSAFATAFQEKYDRLDILVCNAGVALPKYEATRDGWETM
jgi:retinol dehydrogenase 12